jgi:hypothetical protein
MVIIIIIIIIIIIKALSHYLSNIPGNHDIKEPQTTAILCTAHILRKSSDVKAQNTFHGRNNITCSINCKYRTAATLCTVDTRFVSGI